MTGFGAARGRLPGGELRVEVASVNGRGLNVKARLPEALSSSQAEVESRCRARLARGSLTVSVELRRLPGARRARLDQAALAGYVRDFARAAARFPALPPVDWRTLTALPGVLELPREQEGAGPLLLKVLDQALKACARDRDREGRALGRICGRLLDTAESALTRSEVRREPAREAYRSRLSERLAAALGREELPPLDGDLRRELVLHAERSDIAEELARLRTQVKEARRCLASNEPTGRRLDFLSQEMLREANTLGAKSQDAELSLAGLDLKTALDQFKEQVQNIE
jgi:uncharacterized protein (TIGR00255 family)